MRIRNDYTGFSGKGYQDNYLIKIRKQQRKMTAMQTEPSRTEPIQKTQFTGRGNPHIQGTGIPVRSLIRLKRKLPGKIPTQGSLRSSGILLEMRDRQRRQEGSLSILWLLSRI